MTPQEWVDQFNAAQKEFDAGNQEAAERMLAECAKASPEAWVGVGCEALRSGENKIALDRFREALAVSKRPQTRAACLNNIGSIMANVGHRDVARDYFEEALRVHPHYPDSYANLALVRKWAGDIPNAIELCNAALRLNPHHQSATFTKALATLLSGDLETGWDKYESRWRNRETGIRKLEIPKKEWEGEQCGRVLVYAEQGAGDAIQMFRYVKEFHARGIEVDACLPPWLVRLGQHVGFRRVFKIGEPLDLFDAHLPMMSLPRVFKTRLHNIPHANGYIDPPPLSSVIEPQDGLNVGICWRGSSAFKHNLYRSSELNDWKDVLSVEGVAFHSLQVGEGEDEAALFPQIRTYPKPDDYYETAARMAALDLIITIDTSVAHLAGAMGIACWILIPFAPDFRWLLDRRDSPWYSSVRLFRQSKEFDWKSPLNEVWKSLEYRITTGTTC